MLSSPIVDNFRCLENFELDFDQTNVLLAGTARVRPRCLNVLSNIQNLIVRGWKVGEVFSARDISLCGQRNEQRFEIEIRIDKESYRYSLTVQHDLYRTKMRDA